MTDDDWLTNTEAAAILGVHRNTLHNWRTGNTSPPWHQHGRKIRYRRDDLEAWMRKLPGGNRAQPAHRQEPGDTDVN